LHAFQKAEKNEKKLKEAEKSEEKLFYASGINH